MASDSTYQLADIPISCALAAPPMIEAPPTHEAIALRIGTQREAVTKELSRLRKQGLLAAAPGGGWLIPDLGAFKALLASGAGGGTR